MGCTRNGLSLSLKVCSQETLFKKDGNWFCQPVGGRPIESNEESKALLLPTTGEGREGMDVSSSWKGKGTLSPSEFTVSALAFAEKWQRHNSDSPPWSWVDCRKQPFIGSQDVGGYLALESYLCVLPSSRDDAIEEEEEKGETGYLSEKEEAAAQVHYYDYHIVYSASYRVPVLYFRAYRSDGRPLLLNEIEKDLPADSSKLLLESNWTFITYEEHPYLNRPWYKLHPCGTSDWMNLLFHGDAANAAVAALAKKGVVPVELYLVSWFSVVGQVVGLRLPIEMVNNNHAVIDACILNKNNLPCK